MICVCVCVVSVAPLFLKIRMYFNQKKHHYLLLKAFIRTRVVSEQNPMSYTILHNSASQVNTSCFKDFFTVKTGVKH